MPTQFLTLLKNASPHEEEILCNQYEVINEVTATNSPDVLHLTFGSREYHFQFDRKRRN